MKHRNISILYITIFVLHVFMIGAWFQNSSYTYETKAYDPKVVTIPTATPTPHETQSKPSTIEDMIIDTFGEDADKAFLLLSGNEVCGGENGSLDPNAVYENKREDGTVWSRDYNIFQVNDFYHPVHELNLDTDWKANIKYAHRMFEADGYTFSKRWTAGKCLFRNGYSI